MQRIKKSLKVMKESIVQLRDSSKAVAEHRSHRIFSALIHNTYQRSLRDKKVINIRKIQFYTDFSMDCKRF